MKLAELTRINRLVMDLRFLREAIDELTTKGHLGDIVLTHRSQIFERWLFRPQAELTSMVTLWPEIIAAIVRECQARERAMREELATLGVELAPDEPKRMGSLDRLESPPPRPARKKGRKSA